MTCPHIPNLTRIISVSVQEAVKNRLISEGIPVREIRLSRTNLDEVKVWVRLLGVIGAPERQFVFTWDPIGCPSSRAAGDQLARRAREQYDGIATI